MAKESNYKRKKYFAFNLLPEKSQEEIQILEERDNTLLYSFILVFSAVFIYFVLTLIQTVFVTNRVKERNTAIGQLNTIQNSYSSQKAIKGELIQKANLLKSTLEKDIKLDNFLNISNQIAGSEFEITSYGRNSDGDFILSFELNSPTDSVELIKRAKAIENVSNVFAQNIVSKGSSYDFILQFTIENT
jgi:hypothetical protein